MLLGKYLQQGTHSHKLSNPFTRTRNQKSRRILRLNKDERIYTDFSEYSEPRQLIVKSSRNHNEDEAIKILDMVSAEQILEEPNSPEIRANNRNKKQILVQSEEDYMMEGWIQQSQDKIINGNQEIEKV